MPFDDRYPLKDYLNTINQTKKNLMEDDDPAWEKNYPPFVINKCMSQHMDTILMANEMNLNSHIDNRLQFDFFINIVRKKKRFSKWAKAQTISDVEVLKEYYGYSTEKARQASKLLSSDQINELKKKVFKGGRK